MVGLPGTKMPSKPPLNLQVVLLPELRDVVSQCKKRRENFQFSRHAQLKETRKDINYGNPTSISLGKSKRNKQYTTRLVAEK